MNGLQGRSHLHSELERLNAGAASLALAIREDVGEVGA